MRTDQSFQPALSRRTLLRGAAAVAATAGAFGLPGMRAHAMPEVRLSAGASTTRFAGPTGAQTDVLAFNGTVPGPEIRVRQGERLRIAVDNQLGEETTVHWHGLRIPNAMDGVPHLTQKPIAPGEQFVYEFEVPDAGTFWYHPHQRSFEQVGRGLYGALIVEEHDPIRVDRDVSWVLDDWRLLPTGAISDDFGSFMDVSHAGRIGNLVTVNGQAPGAFAVRAGERVRLRLINAANARIFALRFAGHAPTIIAIDGQPVEPHGPDDDVVLLVPAMRIDLVIDMRGKPGERFTVRDVFYRGLEYGLTELIYDGRPLRAAPLEAPIALPPNRIPEPDIDGADRHEVVFGGGMMGRMRSAMMNGRPTGMREMMRGGMAWAINGVVATEHDHVPMLTLKRGRSYLLEMRNETAWPHPIHLHGHSFRVIRRNDAPTRFREWQDTVLLMPDERVTIAFVADNPGDWMFHCHILEHQAGGMMAVLRVA